LAWPSVKGPEVRRKIIGVDGRPERGIVTSRVVRPGQAIPQDREWLDRTVDERIAGVWELTKLCHAWNPGELRLQRSVVRTQRRFR
jgi:hypothetical protein